MQTSLTTLQHLALTLKTEAKFVGKPAKVEVVQQKTEEPHAEHVVDLADPQAAVAVADTTVTNE